MGRKKKYENAEIVKGIFAREFAAMGDLTASLGFKWMDLKDINNRVYLKKQIEEVMTIFNDALKELEV